MALVLSHLPGSSPGIREVRGPEGPHLRRQWLDGRNWRLDGGGGLGR
jgi:hypothetical protein